MGKGPGFICDAENWKTSYVKAPKIISDVM